MKKSKNPLLIGIIICVLLLIVLAVILLQNAFKRTGQTSATFHKNLWDETNEITFHDPDDIAKFKERMIELDKEIAANTGNLTFEQVVEKGRLLEYLGNVGQAIKLYEENFNNLSGYVAYIHNMGRLYEEVEEYDLAIPKYEYIIEKRNRTNYYKDIAEAYKKAGDEKKYAEYMKLVK